MKCTMESMIGTERDLSRILESGMMWPKGENNDKRTARQKGNPIENNVDDIAD